MKDYPERFARISGRLMGAFLVLVLTAACQTISLDYRSGRVLEQDRIALPDNAEQQGVWKTREAVVEYRFARRGNELKISGVMKFAEPITNNFSGIEHSHLDAIFVNPQGKVLEIRGLMSSAFAHPESPQKFENRLSLPPGTESLAFSYQGRAFSSGLDNNDLYSFWYYPIHPK
ncbi:MAG TPA: hypothetical protein PLM79_01595 [Syntrophobacteraceae bacterium]|nr:hypothetical protein [Syntrophobacteraceae bacterium]